MSLVFGNVGVCVEDYTRESLNELLELHKIDDLMHESFLVKSEPLVENTYLQSDCSGQFREFTTLNVLNGYVRYVTDMNNFLHIICVGLIDPDMTNSLVDQLYSQGLIKPRFIHYETD